MTVFAKTVAERTRPGSPTGHRREVIHFPRLRLLSGRMWHHHIRPRVPRPGRSPGPLEDNRRVHVPEPALILPDLASTDEAIHPVEGIYSEISRSWSGGQYHEGAKGIGRGRRLFCIRQSRACWKRGEKIDSLVAKSDGLSAQSKMFYQQAKKQNSCCVVM